LPGVFNGPHGEDVIARVDRLTLAVVVGNLHGLELPSGLIEQQVDTVAVDEYIQPRRFVERRGVLLRKARWRAEQKAVGIEIATVEACIHRAKFRALWQIDDFHGAWQIAFDFRIGDWPTRHVDGWWHGKIRSSERPAAAHPVIGGAAQVTQAGFPGVQLEASGGALVQRLRARRVFAPATFEQGYAPAGRGQAQRQGDPRRACAQDAEIVGVSQAFVGVVILDHERPSWKYPTGNTQPLMMTKPPLGSGLRAALALAQTPNTAAPALNKTQLRTKLLRPSEEVQNCSFPMITAPYRWFFLMPRALLRALPGDHQDQSETRVNKAPLSQS